MNRTTGVIMVGPHPETKSGLASCIRGYLQSSLAAEFNIAMVPTYVYAERGTKLAVALKGLIRFTRLLASRQYSVVHIHTSGYNSFYRKSAFVLLAKLFRKKILLHMHHSRFQRFFEKSRSRAFVRGIIQQADVFIVLSQSWKGYFSEIVHNRIEVIPTAIDTSAPFLPRVRHPRKEILFVGGYWRRKGVFDLIEAFSQVVDTIPDVELILIGFPDEQDRREAENMWQERGLSDKVKMLGWVGEKEKGKKLETAGVFVLPSYGEGMPMGIMEAMAAGVPVVATTVGGIPEEVADGETGYLIPAGDSEALADRLLKILSSPELATRMGEAGRKRAKEQFDLGTVVQRVAALYRESS